MPEEILIDSQFTFFFLNIYSKPEKLFYELSKNIGDIFNNTPIIIPVPEDNRFNNVPIVQMKSPDGIFSCNITRNRIDFFHAGSGKQSFNDIKEDFFQEVKKIYKLLDENEIEIKRIGFVTNFFFIDTDKDKTISKLIIDDLKNIHRGAMSTTGEQAFVRYSARNEIKDISDLKINNLTIIQRFFARISGLGDKIDGVLITRDFNTLNELSENKKKINFLDDENIGVFLEYGYKNFKLEEIKSTLWS